MSRKTPETQAPAERDAQIALFRYGLIAHLLFGPLSNGQMERALREIASRRYAIPYSKRTQVSVSTLRRYLQHYQQGGFDALRPQERADKGVPRALDAGSVAESHCAAPGAARAHHPHDRGTAPARSPS